MTLLSGIFLRKRSGRGLPAPVAMPRDLQSEDEEQKYKPIEWPMIKRLLRTLWPFRRRYALGLFLGIIMIVLEMLSPRFMQGIINYVTEYTAGRIPGGVSQDQAIGHVTWIIVAWGAVLGMALVLQRFVILLMTHAGENVQFLLRRQLFAKLQELSMSYYDRTKLGRIISRCTSDINSLREVNVWGLWQVVANVLMMGVAAIMLVMTDWRLFLSVAWLGPILYVTNDYFRRRVAHRWQVVREWFTRVSTNLAENITGVRVVTAFNRQVMNLDTFNGMQVRNTDNNVWASRLNGVYQPLLQFIGFIGKVTILTFGGYLIVSGRIGREKGVGAVIAAYLYWDWFMNPILNLGNFANQLMMAMAGGERVFALLDMQPEVKDLPDAKPLPRIVGHVKFEHVTFGYKPERPVLHDISFEAHPGQMVALVGHTGSGKSSIISLLARFYQPQGGRILIDGQEIRCVTGQSLHKQMGLVLQANYLFTGTVMENIRYVRPEASEEEVINAAKAIGSHEIILQLQNGYETEVGERGGNMSLGQRQLICFTRAFLADPRIFMLDEATSSVDTETELQVQRSLEKLLEGRTTFIVAHRLSTILRADCILVIDQGRIIERGTHRELLQINGHYAHLYKQFVQQIA
ncbi:MAG: ABC transporter ATP-binding protein [Bacillota bacterium]